MSNEARFDVVAISIEGGNVIWADGPHDAANAEAVHNMAIARQGVEDRFFAYSQVGQYKAGDKWSGGVPLPVVDEDPEYETIGKTR